MTDRPKRPPPGPPPSIGYLRGQGVTSVYVSCGNSVCQRGSTLTFDAIGLPDDTPFPSIATRKRWVCRRCGSTGASVMPSWPYR